MYSKTGLKGNSKIDKIKILMTNGSLIKIKILQNAPLEAFCNTFDLHWGIISLEKQFLVFLRLAVLERFYCIWIKVTLLGDGK